MVAGFVRCPFLFTGTSTGNINTDVFIRRPDYSKFKETSEVTFNIRNRNVTCTNAMVELEPVAGAFELYDNAILNLTIKNQMCPVNLKTGTPTLNLLNSNVKAFPWIIALTCSAGATVNIYNCIIYFDRNDDNTGLHILEDQVGINWNIKNSTLEFSGHNGSWNTMGNPIALASISSNPILLIEDCEIIDNINDGIPFGANYAQCLYVKGSTTIRRTTIKNQNYDGICNNVCLRINKTTGVPLNVILEDVTFISDVSAGHNGNAITIVKTNALDENDYIIANGIINNTQETNICSDMTDYNLLISQAP
jgi:hypothetical protein